VRTPVCLWCSAAEEAGSRPSTGSACCARFLSRAREGLVCLRGHFSCHHLHSSQLHVSLVWLTWIPWHWDPSDRIHLKAYKLWIYNLKQLSPFKKIKPLRFFRKVQRYLHQATYSTQ
jgi:hypothetical protein